MGSGRGHALNRAADIAVGGAALVVSAPLLGLAALAVKLEDRGPVLYRQTRVGRDAADFELLKLRTMVVGAEKLGAGYSVDEGDPRITRVGRILRRLSLDELPQLWNVVRGDMSIVGPRPERPEFLELLVDTVPFWTQRHLLRPGITGWAQVRNGYAADVTDTERKLSYDLWYLRHQSLLVDLMICGRTFATVVRGTGAR